MRSAVTVQGGLTFKDVNGYKPKQMQNLTFSTTYKFLQLLCVSSFEWSGLPITVDKRWLEISNLYSGGCALFQDDVLGYLMLPFTTNGQLNAYGNPTAITVYGQNGYSKTLQPNEYVICWNNYAHAGDVAEISLFTERLTKIKRTEDINIQAQKTPILIQGEKSDMLKLKNLYKNYDSADPVIYGSSGFDFDRAFRVLQTFAPYVADKLHSQWHSEFNDFLCWRGIENSNTDKKERLVADEVSSNYGLVEGARNMYLQPREDFCEEAKEKFGLDIKVRFKSNILTTLNRDNLTDEQIERLEGVNYE